jgi:hypothetical protein
MSIVEKLTEGIVNRDLTKEGAALIAKWEQTGLLEGIGDDADRNGMARLLENQAKELLRESSSMAAGDVQGFAAVAFPLVRRVFGSLIANDLVSVQPMSLPSGLIFFLDFTISRQIGTTTQTSRLGYVANESLYGGQVVGAQITGGVDLNTNGGALRGAAAGPYALNNGYSSPIYNQWVTASVFTTINSGTFGTNNAKISDGARTSTLAELCQFDPDLVSGSSVVSVLEVARGSLVDATGREWNADDLVSIQVSSSIANGTGRQSDGTNTVRLLRRLTQFGSSSHGGPLGDKASNRILLVVEGPAGANVSTNGLAILGVGGTAPASGGRSWNISYPQTDQFQNAAGNLGAIEGTAFWGLEGSADIPEIDIKVDSVPVTAVTKKLKAKWTPELGQDLNAYHNLDAEVELTQILSEQIALEIDREIIEDLVRGQSAQTLYWSRVPGRFVNRLTGVPSPAAVGDFTGNVSEWYETLIETINEVSAQIHRKTLRGGANFVVCGPEVANILEFTAGFRANVAVDSDRGDAGAVKVGSLSKKFDVIVDPYFPRMLVLVGRRGSSFLESGYVYAPYVPLQTTPTIFGVEDFVPRKGVMTRYAKKMVRPDMYGLVVVRDLVTPS